jgi:hypothetical protein
MYRFLTTATLLVLGVCLALPSLADADYITLMAKDARVTPPRPKPKPNDWHWVYGDDLRKQFLGPYVNALPSPDAPIATFNSITHETNLTFNGGQFADTTNATVTFGVALAVNKKGAGPNPPIRVDPQVHRWYPTFNGIPILQISAPDTEYDYNPSKNQATVKINNDSTDTFSLFSVGYRVTTTEIALDNLNRVDNGPGTFLASGIADNTQLLPGASVSFVLNGILPTDTVTVFSDSQFSGASAGNPYTDVSGNWDEFHPAPEPASLALATVGGLILLGYRERVVRRQEKQRSRSAD